MDALVAFAIEMSGLAIAMLLGGMAWGTLRQIVKGHTDQLSSNRLHREKFEGRLSTVEAEHSRFSVSIQRFESHEISNADFVQRFVRLEANSESLGRRMDSFDKRMDAFERRQEDMMVLLRNIEMQTQ